MRLDHDGREIAMGCEELTWRGDCRNRAKWGGYMKGSGHIVPVCGVHARHWSRIAEDMFDLETMSLDALIEMRDTQRRTRANRA